MNSKYFIVAAVFIIIIVIAENIRMCGRLFYNVAVWLRRWAHQRSYSTSSRVSTEMGDRLGI